MEGVGFGVLEKSKILSGSANHMRISMFATHWLPAKPLLGGPLYL